MRLLDRTWPELSSSLIEHTVAVIPAGSSEQHDLHLPLGVDTYIACALADALADERQALVLPPVTVRISEYHRQFCGIEGILGSLKFHGLSRVLFVNGHGATGRPDQASAEQGRTLLDASIQAVRNLFFWLSGLPSEQIAPKPNKTERRNPWTHP